MGTWGKCCCGWPKKGYVIHFRIVHLRHKWGQYVSIGFCCSLIKYWLRVVTSFLFPGLWMQRFPQLEYLSRFNNIHRTCFYLRLLFESKWYVPSKEVECREVSEVPGTFHAQAPQRTLFTNMDHALSPAQSTDICVRTCIWENSKQKFLVKVLNTPMDI